MVLTDPLDLRSRRALRALVFALHRRTATTRTQFPLRVCVGGPDGVVGEFVVSATDRLDLPARTDVLGALVDAATSPTPWVWIERRGLLEDHLADAAWLAATLQVAAESGRDLGFFVVTRKGWRDPRSGASHAWVRPRQGPPGEAA